MDLAARTLVALDWPFVAASLASHARTAAGRARAEAAEPAASVAAVERRFDAIDEMHALAATREGPPPVGGVEDLGQALDAAARGEVLSLDEVGLVAATLAAVAGLDGYLRAHAAAAPVLASLGEALALDVALLRAFDGALDEQGRLCELRWPALGELRRRIASLERRLGELLEGFLAAPENADLLQDRYVTVRGDRFVVPVKAQAKGLGLGIVHDASRSERTVFVEPAAAVPLGNQKRMAEADLKDEERRILAELSAVLGSHCDAVAAALDSAADLDVVGARAAFAQRLGARRPKVGRDGVVDLARARHAVLALAGERVVANDLRLDAGHPVLVLTGPNAGGKTVAMKTIALAALLVRAGCFVPAEEGSRVDFFDPVLADIGDMQTVHEGLSSFSAHLATLKGMLAAAGPSSLLLLDEIAAGTDPAQGGPLARAVLERLADSGARVVATTHFPQVKAMAADDTRVQVAALEVRDARPTFRVVAGAVGESHALAAAARMGLDAALLERARQLMDEGDRALGDALAALSDEKAAAAEASARAAALEADVARRERDLAARERAFDEKAREEQKRRASMLATRMRSAEDEVRRALAALREAPSREKAAAARQAIQAGAGLADAWAGEAAPPVPGRPLRVGDRARVRGVGAVGEVIELDGNQAHVRVGAMTVKVKPADLELVGGAEARAAATPRPRPVAATPNSWLDTALRSDLNTVDLRGLRVEEGLARVDDFLDEAMKASGDVVFVLHGHGTGAMKAAVRESVARSPYVGDWAPAPEDQGGDALTVLRLRDS